VWPILIFRAAYFGFHVGDAADRPRWFSGTLSVAGPCEATGEEPMSDDPDFPKANHALQVQRQARLSRNEAARKCKNDR
jgi:hypothetical protein